MSFLRDFFGGGVAVVELELAGAITVPLGGGVCAWSVGLLAVVNFDDWLVMGEGFSSAAFCVLLLLASLIGFSLFWFGSIQPPGILFAYPQYSITVRAEPDPHSLFVNQRINIKATLSRGTKLYH